MPVTAYIGLGSNIGDSPANIRMAIDMLGRSAVVTAVSSLYRTEPVGGPGQSDFLNAVVQIETELAPEALHACCRSIEDQLGRERTARWGPRTIDLDILLYGDQVLDRPGLTIPHPRMADRGFVLVPLAEIAPNVVHPALRRTVRQLLASSQDRHAVRRCVPGDRNP